MTEEQRIKAEEIVKHSAVDEIEKKYALYEHLATIEEVEKYHLPYRILKDHKKDRFNKGYADIGNLYPLPGYPRDKRPLFNYPNDYDTDVIEYMGGDSSKLKAEHKQTLYDFIKTYSHNYDDWLENNSVWRYNFLHLLAPYDFMTFTVFDFYGDKREISQADLSLLQKTYTRFKDEYLSNPGAYLQDEPTYTDQERKQYTHTSHLVKYDEELVNAYKKKCYDNASDRARHYMEMSSDLDIYPTILANGTVNDTLLDRVME